MDEKKNRRLDITEIFMAKAGKQGWDRCFHGTIKRETDENENPVVRGKIRVKDGCIYAQAGDQWELGEKMDELVLMILDFGLHSDTGIATTIAGTPYFQN